MKIFLDIIPPTATAQEKQVRIVHGRPVFYEPARLKEAKRILTAELIRHRPSAPLTGPLSLHAVWLFPKGRTHSHNEWRSTRPDTDNLEKMLKDCMTRCGFWKDDTQVVRELAEKRWSDIPGIKIEIEELEAHHE